MKFKEIWRVNHLENVKFAIELVHGAVGCVCRSAFSNPTDFDLPWQPTNQTLEGGPSSGHSEASPGAPKLRRATREPRDLREKSPEGRAAAASSACWRFGLCFFRWMANLWGEFLVLTLVFLVAVF